MVQKKEVGYYIDGDGTKTPPNMLLLSPPLAKAAAEFPLSGSIFKSIFNFYSCFFYSCAGRITMKDEPFPTIDSTHTRP